MQRKKIVRRKVKKVPEKRRIAPCTGIAAGYQVTKQPRRYVEIKQLRNTDGTHRWHLIFNRPMRGTSVVKGKVQPTCRTTRRGMDIQTVVQISDETMGLLAESITKVQEQLLK